MVMFVTLQVAIIKEQTMEPSANKQISTEGQGKTNKISILAWVIALALAILVLLGSVLVANSLGYLYVGLKDTKQNVILTYSICDSGVVDRYNQLTFPLEGSGKQTMDDILKNIYDNKNSSMDATCQAIIYFDALYNGKTDTMEMALTRIKDLQKVGIFIDPILNDAASISSLDAVLREASLNTGPSLGGYQE